MQLGKSSFVESPVVLPPSASRFLPHLSFIAFLLLFRRGSGFFLCLRLFWGRSGFEIFFQVADAEFLPIDFRVPIESNVVRGSVVAVGSVNRIENESAVLDAPANRPEFVHAPGQRHGPSPRHQSERGA